MKRTRGPHTRGFSFIEVIVASAIMLIFFSGLIFGVQLMLQLIGQSKAETGARSLALARMEFIRSLDYEAIGTVSGIPSGTVPQTSTTTLNGVAYTERVLILYIDRPEDGLEAADENAVLEDSKRIKVEYSWSDKGEIKTLSLVSDVAPKGMETSSGGGTLIVRVFDADVLAVSGASVRVFNDTVATNTIDMTVSTNSDGRAIIPGVPPRGGYELTVTKSDFSTAGTYDVTAGNPNPNPPHVAVASSTISTMTFFIDELSDVTLRTVGEPVTYEFEDLFDDTTLLAATIDSSVGGGELTLATDGLGSYLSDGQAYSTTTAPTSFTSWQSFDWQGSTPTDTEFKVRLYSESGGTRTPVPDSALSGNSSGFTSGPIDISGLSTTTYSRLALGAELSSSNASSTPTLQDWRLSYIESEPAIANVSIGLSGAKTIGSGVPKYQATTTTNSSGIRLLNLEWDSYNIAVDGVSVGYDLKEMRGSLPYVLPPGITDTLTFVLTSHTPRSLHLFVVDGSGNPVSGADVSLSLGGYNETETTSVFGQVFFGNLPSSGSYDLSVTKSGYQNYSDTLNINTNVNSSVSLTSS